MSNYKVHTDGISGSHFPTFPSQLSMSLSLPHRNTAPLTKPPPTNADYSHKLNNLVILLNSKRHSNFYVLSKNIAIRWPAKVGLRSGRMKLVTAAGWQFSLSCQGDAAHSSRRVCRSLKKMLDIMNFDFEVWQRIESYKIKTALFFLLNEISILFLHIIFFLFFLINEITILFWRLIYLFFSELMFFQNPSGVPQLGSPPQAVTSFSVLYGYVIAWHCHARKTESRDNALTVVWWRGTVSRDTTL